MNHSSNNTSIHTLALITFTASDFGCGGVRIPRVATRGYNMAGTYGAGKRGIVIGEKTWQNSRSFQRPVGA